MSSVAVSDFIIIIFLSSDSKTCCKCVLPSCVSLACDLCVCPIFFFLDSRMSSALLTVLLGPPLSLVLGLLLVSNIVAWQHQGVIFGCWDYGVLGHLVSRSWGCCWTFYSTQRVGCGWGTESNIKNCLASNINRVKLEKFCQYIQPMVSIHSQM